MNALSACVPDHRSTHRRLRAPRSPAKAVGACLGLATGLLLLAGCSAPIGADWVKTREAYSQVDANALRTGRPGAETRAILHRYDLDRLAGKSPDAAVRALHEIALKTGERDLLFALSELSYVAAGEIQRSVKPWDPREARDYYLGSAMYAWLFLFGEAAQTPPGAFDRRFREACDFYNLALGLALAEPGSDRGAINLAAGSRRLPVGQLDLRLDASGFPVPLASFEQILLADQYRVHGLSVRNRNAGVGAPLICVSPLNPQFQLRPGTPATVLLRGPASLGAIAAGRQVCALEVHPAFGAGTIMVGGREVPLENDLTTYRAYTLNQAHIWKLGRLDFLAPAERIPSQLVLNQPFEPGRVPVVFVHGTFSSPVTWAEMANTLTADPELRKRYQVWSFIYGSGNPLVYSVAELRAALTEKVAQLDPAGTNTMLRQMVIIGHSQGGLLTKGTAVDTGDRLWRMISTNRLEELNISDAERANIRKLVFYEPLPFVKRVVFIATPHRGSYLSSSLARRLGQKLVSLPHTLLSSGTNLLNLASGSQVGSFLDGKMPTSLDGMSPKNPGLLAMSEIPVAPGIKAHSIIPVKGDRDPKDGGKDGVVSYASAHIEPVESEYIVRGIHTCLDLPNTIQEVRRILHLHLDQLEPSP